MNKIAIAGKAYLSPKTEMPEELKTYMNGNVVSAYTAKRTLLFEVINKLGNWLRVSGLRRDSFNVDSLLTKAMKKTGLDDFGSNSFREGLDVLVDSLNREANLNTLGRITFRVYVLDSLIARLNVQHWIKEHPEVLEERIEKPFIISGLPRTGTTILSFLLDMDPENRSLLQWEAQNPAPPPQLATASEDPRITKCAKVLRLLERAIPNFHTIHPISATLPAECIMLFEHEFRNHLLIVMAKMPSYLDWLKGADMDSCYKYHQQVLKILQSAIPVQTWSLKSPAHIFYLETLLENYPDVRLIFTHRDPQKVIPSTCSLFAYFRKCLSDNVNLNEIGQEVVSSFNDGAEKLMAFENKNTDNNVYHLQYDRLIKDPIKAVREIYRHFDKEVSPLHEKKMQAWLKFNPQDKHGRHKYSLTDFGLTSNNVEDAFGEYRTRYNIPNGKICSQ